MMKLFKALNKFFIKKAIKIDKRIRLVIAVIFLTAIFTFSTFFYFDHAFIFIPLIFVSTYFFTYFALLEGIEKLSFFGLFIMPEVVAISLYLFYFLFPGRWLTRIPYMVFFAVSLYAILLCSNIFNVGVEKSLGLYRAAFSINFFYQSIVSFLIFNLIAASESNYLVNGLIAFLVSFILSLNLFWSIRLNKNLSREIWLYALFTATAIFQLTIIASFVAVRVSVYALFLTGSYYSISGVIYNFIDDRLFKETIREYAAVFLFILLISLLALNW